MSLPEPDYYALDEIAKRWQVKKRRVRHYLETEKLRACIWLEAQLMQRGTFHPDRQGKEIFHADDEVWLQGFFRLRGEDCRKLFRDGKARISYVLSQSIPQYFYALSATALRWIEPKEIVVLRDEMISFEQVYQVSYSASAGLDGNPTDLFQHSADYQTIWIRGQRFRLGLIQSKVVRLLHEASMTDIPWRHGKRLLDEAGSRCEQLKNLFRSQSQWRQIIESDGRGYYRLNI